MDKPLTILCHMGDCPANATFIRRGVKEDEPEKMVALCQRHSRCEIGVSCPNVVSVIKRATDIPGSEYIFFCHEHHIKYERGEVPIPTQAQLQAFIESYHSPEGYRKCAILNCHQEGKIPCGPEYVCLWHNYCREYPCKAIVPPGILYCQQHSGLHYPPPNLTKKVIRRKTKKPKT